eukprot:6209390-Pleurochrysis_carterae.AAC.4
MQTIRSRATELAYFTAYNACIAYFRKLWSSTSVPTGTTQNLVADKLHQVGSRGISPIFLHQHIMLNMPVDDPLWELSELFCTIIVFRYL